MTILNKENQSNLNRREFLSNLSKFLGANMIPSGIRPNTAPETPTDKNEINFSEYESHLKGSELALIEYQKSLKFLYSPRFSKINKEILNLQPGFLPNFELIPEILEARKNPDFQERVLEIIKSLGIETYEEFIINFKLGRLNEQASLLYGIFYSLSKSDPKRTAIMSDLNLIYKEIDELERLKKSFINPAWNDSKIAYCNLWTTVMFGALDLSHRVAHRVDNNGNPVLKGGKELNAQGMFNWFKEKGSQYGWKNVSNLSYDEKRKLLEQGYIFYGSTTGHNWIVFGININGETYPALTQATYHTSVEIFPKVIQYKNHSGNLSYKYLEESFNLSASFPDIYKIMPNESENEQLWAIHLNDKENPPIRK